MPETNIPSLLDNLALIFKEIISGTNVELRSSALVGTVEREAK